MTIYNWPAAVERVLMPAVGQTVNSAPFVVPRGAKSMVIFVPDLTGVATIKIQSLSPTVTVETTEVWMDVSCFDLTDGTMEALDAIPENAATTLPTSATGGGNLRFVASADQSAAPVLVNVMFNFD